MMAIKHLVQELTVVCEDSFSTNGNHGITQFHTQEQQSCMKYYTFRKFRCIKVNERERERGVPCACRDINAGQMQPTLKVTSKSG